nr:TIGR02757 family protein [Chitinophagaceae bacterium]
ELMSLMDNSPHAFIAGHRPKELKKFEGFCHRTFNATDLLYFISFLRHHYKKYDSLEDAFVPGAHAGAALRDRPSRKRMKLSDSSKDPNNFELQGAAAIPRRKGSLSEAKRGWTDEPVEFYLNYFYSYFFSLDDIPERTRKHIAAPMKNSACKRLNMFLRWMVRDDDKGVDFGLWKKVKPSELIIPLDLHVARVAKRFELLDRPNSDWRGAIGLTRHLRDFDAADPAKYDFALFALGVIERF